MLKLAFVLAAVWLGLPREAAAFTAVLTSDTEKTTVEIADVPGHDGALVYVGWRDLAGSTPTGALVFRKDAGNTETRFFAIGGGPFALVDRGRGTLVGGSVTPVLELVITPTQTLRMKVTLGKTVDVSALAARYQAYEHVAPAKESRAAIEAAVTSAAARVDKACGTKLAVKPQWQTFTKASRLAHVKQVVGVLSSLEPLCADADYRDELKRVKTIVVDWSGTATSLGLTRKGDTLTLVFGDATFNPREVASTWLTDNL